MHALSTLARQSYPPLPALMSKPHYLVHRTQQLRLQYELPLFILLTRLVRLVVLPPYCLFALSAYYIPYNMPAGGHISFCGFGLRNIHDCIEKVGFTVLATEVLLMNISMCSLPGCKSGLRSTG